MRLPAQRVMVCGAALVVSLALAACGSTKHPYDATAENNGYYIKVGQVTYQLQVSRELNQYATEDHQYLVGLPPGTTGPNPDQIWYGVFLRAVNNTKHPQPTTANIDIVDTQGNTYYPTRLDSSINQWAWTDETLQPSGTQPAPNTTAFYGPTQGGLVLFKLPSSIYANRPLTLQIHAPDSSQTSTISLDL